MVVHFAQFDILMRPEYFARFDAGAKCICFPRSGRTTFHSLAALYAESIAIAPTLCAPLVVSDVVDSIPEGFVEGVPKLQYSFAPPEKRRFSVPAQTAAADQTAELT